MALIVLIFAVPAGAVNVTVQANPGTTQFVPNINATATGDNHVGMAITGRFVDPTGINPSFDETIFWENTGLPNDGFGSASDGGWGVSLSGDSFTASWILSNQKVVSGVSYYLDYVEFDALAGNAVFDRTFGGLVGTPGSALGADFAYVSDDSTVWNGDLLVTYIDQVALTGSQPVGDVYARMKIDFYDILGTNLGTKPFFGGSLVYTADTDYIVPLPPTALLLGSGLLGLAVLGRRRKKQ
jgi:hypothetical protein